jgi:hypothetical protein
MLTGMAVALLAALSALVYTQMWLGVALTSVALLVIAYQGRQWISEPQASWRDLVIGSALGVLGIASSFVHWPWL